MHEILDIVIPVYNEGPSILSVLEAIDIHVKTKCRVLICFDNDDDTTLPVLTRYKPKNFTIKTLKNKGHGAHGAVMTGFNDGNSEAVMMLPADDDYNQPIIDLLMTKFKEGNDIVCPSRFMKGGKMEGCPFLKNILVRTANFTLYHIAGLPTHDASNGFRLFSRRVIDNIKIESNEGFTYSIEYLVKAHRQGWKISEVPVEWHERKFGESRFRIMLWLLNYLRWYVYGIGNRFVIKH